MAEWKVFSLRNGIKFNILGLMRYLFIVLAVLVFPFKAIAQNTIPTESPKPVSTITVETKVVEILLNDEHRKGVDWEAIVSDFHSVQLKKENNPVWADKKYRLSVGQVNNEDYAVLLDALDTVGHFIQSDFPSMTLSMNEAKEVDATPDPKNLPKIELNLKWYGVSEDIFKLKVEPRLRIIIKDGAKVAQEIQLRTQTELEIKDNATIIIGGLFHEQEISKVKKFPLLGDLPLVGLVFRKQGKLMQKTETIIFLTVHANTTTILSDNTK